MTKIMITIDPFKVKNCFQIDGEKITKYSELSNYINEPFIKWVNKLFPILEEEINDEFELEIQSFDFEYWILDTISNSFDLCTSVTRSPFLINDSISDRVTNLVNSRVDFPVVNLLSYNIPKKKTYSFVNFTETENMKKGEIICSISDSNVQLSFIESSDNQIITNDNQLTIKTNKELTQTLVERYIDSIVIAPLIHKLCLSNSLIFDAINPVLTCEKKISLDVGENTKLEIRSNPSHEIYSNIYFEFDSSLIEIKDDEIIAKNKGDGAVSIFYRNEVLPVATFNVEIKDKYLVSSVVLSSDKKVYKTDESINLSTVFSPVDADDIDSFMLSSNDETIVKICDGEPKILKEGNVVLTISNSKLKSSVELTILPYANEIKVEQTHFDLNVGDCEIFEINVLPINSFSGKILNTSSDKRVAYLEEIKDNTYRLKANGIGSCVISIYDETKHANVDITVNVKSTLYKEKVTENHWIKYAIFLTITSVFLNFATQVTNPIFLLIPLFALICAISSMVKSKKSIPAALVCIVVIVILVTIGG